MIEGRKLTVITKNPRLNDGRPMGGLIEHQFSVTTFKKYLFSEEPPEDGSLHYRKKDIIQFYADPGGLRTVYAEDVIL